MSSVFYDPTVDFDRLFSEAMFSRYNGVPQRRHDHHVDNAVSTIKPRMDLHEDKEKNMVTAVFELPGVSKENINIDIHHDRLTITAESKISSEHDENGYAVRERRYGKYSRSLQIPQGVKDTEVKASMDNGVLTVTFPKVTSEMAPKKVEIA
ncbi:small heat shock protein [Amanita rubescens]|nr:small heat shock protein [Amanita rubescens]